MSEPNRPGASEGKKEKRKSISKYLKRVSSVFRRGGLKDTGSSSAAQPATTPADVPSESAEASEQPATAAVPASPSTTQPQQPPVEPITTNAAGAFDRRLIQQERARMLFAKYGLTLEAQEWVTTGPTTTQVQRVEKPIRMRIHRTCHKCQTTFGTDRVCQTCYHNRCKSCPRFPEKKDKRSGKSKAVITATTTEQPPETTVIDASAPRSSRAYPYLAIRNRAGAAVVYTPSTTSRSTARVTCHQCRTPFPSRTATECTNCKHTRCTLCPREPAPRLKIWPDAQQYQQSQQQAAEAGYTSDELDIPTLNRVWRKTRQRVRWSCCACANGRFASGSKNCVACDHRRCETCTRLPPKKQKKEFDPELVKSVEEKLARLKMESESEGVVGTS